MFASGDASLAKISYTKVYINQHPTPEGILPTLWLVGTPRWLVHNVPPDILNSDHINHKLSAE